MIRNYMLIIATLVAMTSCVKSNKDKVIMPMGTQQTSVGGDQGFKKALSREKGSSEVTVTEQTVDANNQVTTNQKTVQLQTPQSSGTVSTGSASELSAQKTLDGLKDRLLTRYPLEIDPMWIKPEFFNRFTLANLPERPKNQLMVIVDKLLAESAKKIGIKTTDLKPVGIDFSNKIYMNQKALDKVISNTEAAATATEEFFRILK